MTYLLGDKPTPPPFGSELLAKYMGVSTATIGHITDFGAAVGLVPLFRPCKAVGYAVTVRLPQGDGSMLHEAVSRLDPGDFLVVDTSGEERRAMWGGLAAYSAARAGAAGVVIDGPITDWEELTALGTPVWSRNLTTPLTGRRLRLEGQANVDIQVAGVPVSSGDLVVADSDGVYFLSPDTAATLAEQLIAREEREILIKERIDAGESLIEIATSISEADSKERTQ